MPPIDQNLLRRRIAETAAWCARRASRNDPANSLRTPALRPSNRAEIAGADGYYEYEWENAAGEFPAIQAVSELAEKRSRLLGHEVGEHNSVSILPPGRLLVVDPLNSDSSGLSEPDSAGFLDVFDIPGWDTWIAFLDEPRSDAEDDADMPWWYARRGSVAYLMCWITADFAPLVQNGIAVNPMDCLFWASDWRNKGLDTETLRLLEADGLL